jgi:RNA 2',3'-cyclic 3'-phosphodiesterase
LEALLIRAFIAVTLAQSVIEEIAKVRAALQTAKGDIRWTRLEGLHLTLKFLGNIPRTQVEPILATLTEALRKHSSVQISVQGLGAFPTLKRPRVLWVGLTGVGLAELSETIETSLMRLDFPPEDREFAPHLTLGRVRSPRGWEQVLAVVKQRQQDSFGESHITQVTLYQSTLQTGSAVYSALGSVSLQQPL